MAGAGKNGSDRQKQRQRWGQTTINQKAASIAAEMVIVAAAATVATETAVAVAAVAPTVAEAARDAAAAAAAECDRCKRAGIRFHVHTKVSTYLHRFLFVSL